MKKMWLVWNPSKTECVGFDNEKDAHDTAYGDSFSLPTLGDNFRETYADDDDDAVFIIQEVSTPV